MSNPLENESAGPTVLVVDPDSVQRQLSTLLLRQCGCGVVEAEGGPEAKAIVRDETLDIVVLITSMRLPESNGVILSRELTEQRPGLQTIFTSVCPYAEVVGTYGDSIPRACFMRKPFSAATLRAMLHELQTPTLSVQGFRRPFE